MSDIALTYLVYLNLFHVCLCEAAHQEVPINCLY